MCRLDVLVHTCIYYTGVCVDKPVIGEICICILCLLLLLFLCHRWGLRARWDGLWTDEEKWFVFVFTVWCNKLTYICIHHYIQVNGYSNCFYLCIYSSNNHKKVIHNKSLIVLLQQPDKVRCYFIRQESLKSNFSPRPGTLNMETHMESDFSICLDNISKIQTVSQMQKRQIWAGSVNSAFWNSAWFPWSFTVPSLTLF